MDLAFDESKLLYGLGGFLGVIAILYFGSEIIFDLSPTVKSFLLLSGTVLFLTSAEYVKHSLLRSSFYVFSGFSYLIFLLYTLNRFNFTSDQVFLTLVQSSVLFIVLGYLKSEKDYNLGKELARKTLVGLAVLVLLVLAFDMTGAQPDYNLKLNDSVDVVEGEEFNAGVLEVRNDFPLSRNVDMPSYRGCLFVAKGKYDTSLHLGPEDIGIISGSDVERFNLTATVRTRPDRNTGISGAYDIVRGECPEDPDNMTIYIWEADGRGVLRSEVMN